MEELEKYLLENIIFDEHNDESGEDFGQVLSGELDRITMYASEVKKIFNIDPVTIIELCQDYDVVKKEYYIKSKKIIDIELLVNRALDVLAFDYMYAELKAEYMRQLEI